MMTVNRPKGEYDVALGDFICAETAATEEGLDQILARWMAMGNKAVSVRTIHYWKKNCPQFKEDYLEAKEMQAQLLVSSALQEARTVRTETKVIESAKGRTVMTCDNARRSQLIVETLFKRAAQLAPKEFSEKIAHTGGDGEGPVQFEVRTRSILELGGK